MPHTVYRGTLPDSECSTMPEAKRLVAALREAEPGVAFSVGPYMKRKPMRVFPVRLTDEEVRRVRDLRRRFADRHVTDSAVLRYALQMYYDSNTPQ